MVDPVGCRALIFIGLLLEPPNFEDTSINDLAICSIKCLLLFSSEGPGFACIEFLIQVTIRVNITKILIERSTVPSSE